MKFHSIKSILLAMAFVPVYIGSTGFQLTHMIIYPMYMYHVLNKRISRLSFWWMIIIGAFTVLSFILSEVDFGLIDSFVLFLMVLTILQGSSKITVLRIRKLSLILGAVMILSVLFQFINPSSNYLDIFVNPDSDTRVRSLNNFRYTGIFGSPFEAGVFIVIWYHFSHAYTSRFTRIPALILGFFTISKAFFIGLLFLFFKKKYLHYFVILSVILFISVECNYVAIPRSINHLIQGILEGDISTLSANRFGEDSTVQSRITWNLLVPNGFATIGYAVDSYWLYVFTTLGFLGFFWVFFQIRTFRKMDSRILTYLILTTLGAPVFFKNTIMLLILYNRNSDVG